MRRVLAFAILLSVSSMLAQTKGKSAPAPASNDGERVVQLDEQMANIVVSDKSNCDKMAADIKAFADKNGKEMQRLHDEGMKRTPEERTAFMKKYGARIQAARDSMNASIPSCIQNAKVKAALSALSGGGKPPASPAR